MGIRTTVTLDKDLYQQIKRESQKEGRPFKDVLNDTVRQGLKLRTGFSLKDHVFPTFKMGERPGLNYDCISELLEQIEGPLHK